MNTWKHIMNTAARTATVQLVVNSRMIGTTNSTNVPITWAAKKATLVGMRSLGASL